MLEFALEALTVPSADAMLLAMAWLTAVVHCDAFTEALPPAHQHVPSVFVHVPTMDPC